MSNRTQFEQNYLPDIIIILIFSELFLTVYFNHFQLENGAMATPKRRSTLALIFACC